MVVGYLVQLNLVRLFPKVSMVVHFQSPGTDAELAPEGG